MIEGEVVTEEHAAAILGANHRQQAGEGGDIFPVDLHQRQRLDCQFLRLLVHGRVHRLHEGRFAGAPRSPQQRIVRRKAACKAQRVLVKLCTLPVNAVQEIQFKAVGLLDGIEMRSLGLPDEDVAVLERKHGGRRWRHAVESIGNANEKAVKVLWIELAHWCHYIGWHLPERGAVGMPEDEGRASRPTMRGKLASAAERRQSTRRVSLQFMDTWL